MSAEQEGLGRVSWLKQRGFFFHGFINWERARAEFLNGIVEMFAFSWLVDDDNWHGMLFSFPLCCVHLGV